MPKYPLLFLLFFTACQPARQTMTIMQVTSLKALDLEETISRQDELLMAYTLTSFDQRGKAMAVSTGSWGIQEAKTGQTFSEKAFQSIEIPLPKNGKVVASLVLLEIDDYENAQKTLAEIRKYHDYIKVPAGLAELADVALTPIKYISVALSVAGIGFQLADRLDDDDLLGQNQAELTYEQAQTTPVRRVPLTFKNSHLGSSFNYELAYDLRSRSVRMKPVRKAKS